MGFITGLLGLNGGGGSFQAVAPGQQGLSQAGQPVQQNLNDQQAFVNATAGGGAQGLAAQQGLTGQLQAEAAGQGPNPAQAQLAQNTGANVANQAALQAGQRGSASNVGLMARQIGQQGAATQQNAVGQAATLQAQQQLAAQQQLQQQAATQVGQQAGALNQASSAALGNQGQVYGLQSGANTANAGVAQKVAEGQQGLLGGVLGGGGVLSTLFGSPSQNQGTVGGAAQGVLAGLTGGLAAQGGEVTPQGMRRMPTTAQAGAGMYAEGGKVGPRSAVGRMLCEGGPAYQESSQANFAKGGKVPVMVSPGEKILTPQKAQQVAKGKANPMEGQTVPGKAKVKGDSLKNDVVPKKLAAGSVVLRRSIVNSEDPAESAHKFVSAVMAKKTLKR